MRGMGVAGGALRFAAAGAVLSAAFAAPPPPAARPGAVPAGRQEKLQRLELFDAKTRRVWMVVYYEKADQAPAGIVKFTGPRVLLLAKTGESLEALVRSPVGEVTGRSGWYDPAAGLFHFEGVWSCFKQVSALAASAASVPVEIRSERLDVTPERAQGVYDGEVFMTHGDLSLSAERLEIAWDPATKALKSARATGSPVVADRPAREHLVTGLLEHDFTAGRTACPRGGEVLVWVRSGGKGR